MTNMTSNEPRSGFVAIVTGGSGAIGQAVCRRLASDGVRIALTYHHHRPEELLAHLAESGSLVHAASLDLSNQQSTKVFVEEVLSTTGSLDQLVHAAGPHVPQQYLSATDPLAVQQHVSDDVANFFNIAHAALPALRSSKGAMVAVTTAATDRYPARDGLSSVPKAAVEALVRGLAVEEGKYGVRVNCVAPGVLTDGISQRLMDNGDFDERALAAMRPNIPMRSFGTAVDVAEAVCFLVSGRARYITGQKLNVDGGFTA